MGTGHPIVVGIVPRQDEVVPMTARNMAEAYGERLIFIYADPSQISVDGIPGHATSFDPDLDDDGSEEEQVTEQIESELAEIFSESDAQWEFRYVAGASAASLARIACETDASFIMIGSREPGLGPRIKEFLSGPVAITLIHTQPRPVIVIPQKHSDAKNASPWA